MAINRIAQKFSDHSPGGHGNGGLLGVLKNKQTGKFSPGKVAAAAAGVVATGAVAAAVVHKVKSPKPQQGGSPNNIHAGAGPMMAQHPMMGGGM